MNDQEIAAYIIHSLSFRIGGKETAICQAMERAGTDDAIPGVLISLEDRRLFDGLKTQFAAELANAGKVARP